MNITTLVLHRVHHKLVRASEDSTSVRRLLHFVEEPADVIKDTLEIK